MQGIGLHHFSRRKRIYQKHEPYPHPNKWKRLMDKLIYVIGILGPIMTIPQLMKVWIEKNVAGLSIVSWGAYLIIAIFWLVYGIMHKDKPIVFSSGLWIIVHSLIIVGVVLYE